MSNCPYNQRNCMCQFCEDPCNNGLNCCECRWEGKAVHDIHLCTGFKGNLDAYIDHSIRYSKEEDDGR